MDRWAGYLAFKVLKGPDGSLLPEPKYVSFRDRTLCGYYSSETEAGLGFLRGDLEGTRLEDYQGIDGRLK